MEGSNKDVDLGVEPGATPRYHGSLLYMLESVTDKMLKEVEAVVALEYSEPDNHPAPQTLEPLSIRNLYRKRTLDSLEIVLLLGANTYVKKKRFAKTWKLTYLYFFVLARQYCGPNFVRFPENRSYHNMRRRMARLRAKYNVSYDSLKGIALSPPEIFRAESTTALARFMVKESAVETPEVPRVNDKSVPPSSVSDSTEDDIGKAIRDVIVNLESSQDDTLPKLKDHGNLRSNTLIDFQQSAYYLQMKEQENDFRKHYLAQFIPDVSSGVMSQIVVAVLSDASKLASSSAAIDTRYSTSSPLCQNLLRSLFFIVIREKDYSKANSLLNVILQYVKPDDADHSRFMMYRAYLDFCCGKMSGANDLYNRLVNNLSIPDKQICISLKLDVLVGHGRYERALELYGQFSRVSALEDFLVWSQILNARLELSIVLDDSETFRELLLDELAPFTRIPNANALSLQVLVNALLWQITKQCPWHDRHVDIVCDLTGTLLVGLVTHENESAMWKTRRTVENIGIIVPKALIYTKMLKFGMRAYANCRCILAQRLLERTLQSSHVTSKANILLKLGQLRSMSGDHEAADRFLSLALDEAEAEAGQSIMFASCLVFLGNSKVFQGLWDEAELLYARAEKMLKAGGYTRSKVFFELQVALLCHLFHKGKINEVCLLLTEVLSSLVGYYGKHHYLPLSISIFFAAVLYWNGDDHQANEHFNITKARVVDEFSSSDPAYRLMTMCISAEDYVANFLKLSKDDALQGDGHLLIHTLYPRAYNTGSSFGKKSLRTSIREINQLPEPLHTCSSNN